jgi:hypothetical protein
MDGSDKRNRTPYVPHNVPSDPTTSTSRTAQKHAAKSEHYAKLAREAKANCHPADGDDIDLIVNSMAKMALMHEKFEGGGGRQTGGQPIDFSKPIDFMVPMLLLFSRDVNAFFRNAGGNVDAIINLFADWWSRLSVCVRAFWRSIFGTGQDHNAAAAALLELGGEQQPEREQNTWNYIMEMIGDATTSAMKGAATAGTAAGEGATAAWAAIGEGATAVQTKTQPYTDWAIGWAKDNPVRFGAMVAAMGSNIYLFGDTFVDGAMGLLHFLQGVPFTYWMVATSIIASYLALRGTGNIEDDRDALVANKNKLVKIIMAVPEQVIVATHTTPAKIRDYKQSFTNSIRDANTKGMVASRQIREGADAASLVSQLAFYDEMNKLADERIQITTINKGKMALSKWNEEKQKQKQKQIANIMRDKKNIAPISQWIDNLPNTTVGKDRMQKYQEILQNTDNLQQYLERGDNSKRVSGMSNFLHMKWKEWKETQPAAAGRAAATTATTAAAASASSGPSAGSGAGHTLDHYGFGPSAKAGGKRNTKKRSNKKKKTKKHKKKQHRKTKRG